MIIKQLKEDNRESIIYGCGLIGQEILPVLQKENIPVIAWCDDLIENGSSIQGLRVYSKDECLKKFPEANFITAFTLPCSAGVFMKNSGLKRIFSGAELLSDRVQDLKGRMGLHEYSIWRSICHYQDYYSSDIASLPRLGVIITEKCSLSCKNCCIHSSRIPKPQHYPFSVFKDSMDNLLGYFDQLNFANIIGGEPFLNPWWHEFVQYLINAQKVNAICVTTNGTILPEEDKIKVLAHDKVLVYISGYTCVRKKASRLCELLEKHNVHYHLFDYSDTSWVKVLEPEKQGRSKEEHHRYFKNCPFNTCYALLGNKLFRCTTAGNISRIGLIESDKQESNEFIDLKSLEAGNLTPKDGRKIIEDHLFSDDPLAACDYCDLKINNGQYITPGEQF